jgi:hypothetical protein
MSIKQFWESSLVEINDYIDSARRIKKREAKEEILRLFMLAAIINERHPMVDKEKQDFSAPWDFYPELFEEERAFSEKQKEIEEFEAYKERRRQYAFNHNKRNK